MMSNTGEDLVTLNEATPSLTIVWEDEENLPAGFIPPSTTTTTVVLLGSVTSGPDNPFSIMCDFMLEFSDPC